MKEYLIVLFLSVAVLIAAMSAMASLENYDFEREITIDQTSKENQFTIELNSSLISLHGNSNNEINLDIKFKEKYDNDISFYVKKGRLEMESKSGSDARIEYIKGTVPSDIMIEIASIGDVEIDNFTNLLNISTVSGKVEMNNCVDIKAIEANSVSGEIELNELQNIEDLNLNAVSGDISLHDCNKIMQLNVASISGDVLMNNVEVEILEISSISGDCIIKGSTLNTISSSTTSGDIFLQNTTYIDGSFDSVSGETIKDASGEVN